MLMILPKLDSFLDVKRFAGISALQGTSTRLQKQHPIKQAHSASYSHTNLQSRSRLSDLTHSQWLPQPQAKRRLPRQLQAPNPSPLNPQSQFSPHNSPASMLSLTQRSSSRLLLTDSAPSSIIPSASSSVTFPTSLDCRSSSS